MQSPSADAFLEQESRENFAELAPLYDKFAHALDPFSRDRDSAENAFNQQVAFWYDAIQPPKPSLHDFKKAVIARCKRHLLSQDKPSSIPPH